MPCGPSARRSTLREALSRSTRSSGGNTGRELQLRIGINTGEVSPATRGRRAFVTGDAVNVAMRLQQAALPGETMLGAATLALVARGSGPSRQ